MKKLSKLKTMDTKPGDQTAAHQPHMEKQCSFIVTELDFLSAGIYTAYRTFLHKDKILIKRLLKVKRCAWTGEDAKLSSRNWNLSVSAGHPEEEAVGGSERHPEETPAGADAKLHHSSGEETANHTASCQVTRWSTLPVLPVGGVSSPRFYW